MAYYDRHCGCGVAAILCSHGGSVAEQPSSQLVQSFRGDAHSWREWERGAVMVGAVFRVGFHLQTTVVHLRLIRLPCTRRRIAEHRYDICAYFSTFLPIYTVMVLASHLPVSSRPIWPPSRIGAAWLLSFAVTLRRLQFPDSGGYILG